MHSNITLALAALETPIAREDDEATDRAVDILADAIIAHGDTMTRFDVDDIMRTMRRLDFTESLFAAFIRDTLRDNTDFSP